VLSPCSAQCSNIWTRHGQQRAMWRSTGFFIAHKRNTLMYMGVAAEADLLLPHIICFPCGCECAWKHISDCSKHTVTKECTA
jgi:hypothetical protein